MVSLKSLKSPGISDEYPVADTEFEIHPMYTRRVYAKEAAGVLLVCAQTFRSMKEVVGLCDAEIVALMATLRRLGLEERG